MSHKKGLTRILACSDLHCPIHDEKTVEALISRIKSWHPTVVVIVGDLIDSSEISRFPTLPEGPTYQEELDEVTALLKRIRAALGKGRLILCQGNHDLRVETKANDTHLYSLRCLKLPSLLGIPNLEFHPECEPVIIGNCAFQHRYGEQIAIPSPLACQDRLTSLGSGVSAYFSGHNHRVSYRHVTYPGGFGGVYELGCLIDRDKAQYQYVKRQPQYWVHAWFEIVTDGINYPRVTPVILP